MELEVRRARHDDLKKLVSFAVEEAREAEGIDKTPVTLRAGVKSALNDENLALYWVLVDEKDEPVGNISALKEWSNFNAGFYWWIQSVYILPEYRGKGYMSRLFDTVKAEAQKQGAVDIRLYVHEDNERAVKAYQKYGFTESMYIIMTYKF